MTSFLYGTNPCWERTSGRVPTTVGYTMHHNLTSYGIETAYDFLDLGFLLPAIKSPANTHITDRGPMGTPQDNLKSLVGTNNQVWQL